MSLNEGKRSRSQHLISSHIFQELFVESICTKAFSIMDNWLWWIRIKPLFLGDMKPLDWKRTCRPPFKCKAGCNGLIVFYHLLDPTCRQKYQTTWIINSCVNSYEKKETRRKTDEGHWYVRTKQWLCKVSDNNGNGAHILRPGDVCTH